jgi:hypothetical protein
MTLLVNLGNSCEQIIPPPKFAVFIKRFIEIYVGCKNVHIVVSNLIYGGAVGSSFKQGRKLIEVRFDEHLLRRGARNVRVL